MNEVGFLVVYYFSTYIHLQRKRRGWAFFYDPAVLFVAGFGAEAGAEGAEGVEGVPLVAAPAGGVDVEPPPAVEAAAAAAAAAEAGATAGLLPLLADLLPNFSWMARICSSTLGAGIGGGGGGGG
jgi:hypothetical protein